MNIILSDSEVSENLLPFTFTRPMSEIRIGINTIHEKWERAFNTKISYFQTNYLSELYPFVYAKDNFFISGNILPDENLVKTIKLLKVGEILKDTHQNLMAFRYDFEKLKKQGGAKTVIYENDYKSIIHKHDIFTLNHEVLIDDFNNLTKSRKSCVLNDSNKLIGNPRNLFIEEGAIISGATINCETGPVYIGKNTLIMEGSCIRGPFALLDQSVVKMGAKIYGATTIGPCCKVGGEINNVVMFGYSNKAHDGYLGNAVVGEWCNIGAGTDASNLKNNYSEVAQWNYASKSYENTGLQFCGLMMGDHSKCSIGSMFNTGTVVGVCCNLFGADFHRSFIPSFSTGNRNKGYSKYPIEKLLESEQAMFLRRGIEMSEDYKKMLVTISNIQ